VTTPLGTTTQNTNTSTHWNVPRTARDAPGLNAPNTDVPSPVEDPVPIPPPLGSASLPHSLAPHGQYLSRSQSSFDPTYSPEFQNLHPTPDASFMGNPSNRHLTENQPPGGFNHAIQYLNNIRAQHPDDANTYKQILDILQTYQKERRHLQDVSGISWMLRRLHRFTCLGKFPLFSPSCIAKSCSCSTLLPALLSLQTLAVR